jgi:hypothetical protein
MLGGVGSNTLKLATGKHRRRLCSVDAQLCDLEENFADS